MKYRDLLASAVCNVDKEKCMLHKCEKCPGIPRIKQAIEENIDLNKLTETVKFKHWDRDSTRASLESYTENKDKFLDSLCSDI